MGPPNGALSTQPTSGISLKLSTEQPKTKMIGFLQLSWASLEPLLGSLGLFWDTFGPLLGLSWALLGSLGHSWASLRPVLGSLGLSWTLLGLSWTSLGAL